jgi:hypothetical protein
MCCDGVVVFGTNYLCCEHQVYDPTIQVCCQNVVVYGDSCCSSSGVTYGYVINTHICCDGSVLVRSSIQLECCGTSTFDPQFQTCCSMSQIVIGDSCCNNVGYNSSTHKCCDGAIIEGTDVSCCGTQGYLATFQTCCSGLLVVNGDSCCFSFGTVIGFYSDYQVCCNGIVSNGPTCCNGVLYVGAGQSCCENTMYDQENEVCCAPNMVVQGDSCCLNNGLYTGYLREEQNCCDGILVNGMGISCCGQIGYNSTTHVCCDGNYVALGNACCVSSTGTVGYDSKTKSCCRGVVIPIASPCTSTRP